MKTVLFCLIFFIGIHYINTLECYSCLSVGQNTTDCHDQFNTNQTSISRVNVTTSDALCTKAVGKLSGNIKFTLRRASANGCPRINNITDIVVNKTGIKIKDVSIHCCNKHLCNQATNRECIQWNFLILTTIVMYLF